MMNYSQHFVNYMTKKPSFEQINPQMFQAHISLKLVKNKKI
jgi:hypothetical protein